MTPERGPRPVDIARFPNGEIGIRWDDGHESFYDAHALRCACACASCVDEMTGRQLLDAERVPEDVHALAIHPVGNYAISIAWSDGHETGIYAFRHLRELG